MSAGLTLEIAYVLTGGVIAVFALITFTDRTNPRRVTSGLFWLLLAAVFAFGGVLPHRATGVLVLAMVALDGAGRVRGGRVPDAFGEQTLGNRIFAPVLLIPAVTILFAIAFRLLGLDPTRGALLGLAAGAIAAMAAGLMLTRASPAEMMREGQRLNDAMGPVNILPQLLASLGVIFTVAGVGDLIARGIQSMAGANSLFLLVVANCLGMTLFTIVMGNSFAALPVIASGVTIPLLVRPFGADPAMAGILTLTAGSTGTLVTMMAANFNVVPAALLNMHDTYGVIRFQLPFALVMWVAHVLLLWGLIRWS